MRVRFCGAGRARVYVVVSVGVCNLPSCIRVRSKSKGRGLNASLALNTPASLFFLQDGVLPVIRKIGRRDQIPLLSELCWPVSSLV